MSTYSDHILHLGSQHLAEMKRKAAEFERQLWDAHESLDYELAHSPFPQEMGPEGSQESSSWPAGDQDFAGAAAAAPAELAPDRTAGGAWIEEPAPSPDVRTAELASHGRRGPKRRHRARGLVLAVVAAAAIAALVTALVLATSGPGPAWPASVAKVQREIAVACRNPNVSSEPSQVNFACAKSTRQILWVFSLLTSGNNPDYASIKTGRQGLEPITPAQGGAVAWSLNLHHPYNPGDPIDSLAVAARAINNIIGGATLTAANGKPEVQPGLESSSANCRRYTGSGAMTSRNGFPDRCAKPIDSVAGRANLVADVFQKWVVGAPPSAAQNAAVLFENAKNPGAPQVRSILRSIQAARSHG